MDHFDCDEELARLRRAVYEVKKTLSERGIHRQGALLKFIVDTFSTIDEHLVRLGDLPIAWTPSPSRRRKGKVEDTGKTVRRRPKKTKTPRSRGSV
jgi:hypothetical protein